MTVTDTQRDIAVERALSLVGACYQFAGYGPCYDCSGVVKYAWAERFPHMPHQSSQIRNNWVPVVPAARLVPYSAEARAALLPGDLGIYYPLISGSGKIVGCNHINIVVENDGTTVHCVNASDEELGVERIRLRQYGDPFELVYLGH